jgi:CheY-like chemotaxis protein
MKVLIVEDHPDMREVLRLFLESLYYVPVLASHGKEGVEKAISEKPKLILMDIRMPVMDGWQAAKALRANPDTEKIPILATTALFRPDELRACLEAGCDGYIVKPFSVLSLKRKIEELLINCSYRRRNIGPLAVNDSNLFSLVPAGPVQARVVIRDK